MKIVNPVWLYYLWLIPLIIIIGFLIFKIHHMKLKRICEKDQFKRLVPEYSFLEFKIRYFILTGVFVFALISLARFQWGYSWNDISQKGIDVVIALDVSDSMGAEDISPNRLQRAKRKISDLLKIMRGDRVSLVAFSGAAFIQSPLTSDYGAVTMFLDYIDTDLIPVKGTNIGAALRSSIKALDSSENNSKAILLLTDGEDLDDDALPAAKEAKKKGIRLYSIGIATEKGAPIPNKQGGGFKKSENGEIIFSKLNESILSELAKETDGYFVRSVPTDDDLIKIYEHEMKMSLKDNEYKSTKEKIYTDRFQFFIGIIIFLILFESLYFERKKILENLKKLKFFLYIICLKFLIIFTHINVFGNVITSDRFEGEKNYKIENYDEALKKFQHEAVNQPDNAEVSYNLGNAYYKMGDFSRAQDAWKLSNELSKKIKDINKRKEININNNYNIGNAKFKEKKYQEAIDSYRKVLEFDPNEKDSLHNLKIAEVKLEQEKMEKNKNQNNDKNNNEDKNNQDENSQDQMSRGDGKQENNRQEKKEKEIKDRDNKEKYNELKENRDQENEYQENKDGQKTINKSDQKDKNSSKKNQNDSENYKQNSEDLDRFDNDQLMKKDDAQRLLDSVEDNQKQAIKRRVEKQMRQNKHFQNTKDW